MIATRGLDPLKRDVLSGFRGLLVTSIIRIPREGPEALAALEIEQRCVRFGVEAFDRVIDLVVRVTGLALREAAEPVLEIGACS